MRCTVAALTPWARAMVRQLQWVAPGGVVWVVAATIALTLAAEIVGLRPRPGLVWVSACGPPAAKRSRHRITVGRLTDSWRAIALLDSPAAAMSTRRARMATLCGVPWAATQRSKTRRCSVETVVLEALESMTRKLS